MCVHCTALHCRVYRIPQEVVRRKQHAVMFLAEQPGLFHVDLGPHGPGPDAVITAATAANGNDTVRMHT